MSNLLSILGAATGRTPQEAAAGYTQYGPLKADTAEAVVELLRPVQERYRELAADPGATDAILRKGAQKARAGGVGHPGPGPAGHRPAAPVVTAVVAGALGCAP